MSYQEDINKVMFQYAKIIKEKDEEIEKLKKMNEKLRKEIKRIDNIV